MRWQSYPKLNPLQQQSFMMRRIKGHGNPLYIKVSAKQMWILKWLQQEACQIITNQEIIKVFSIFFETNIHETTSVNFSSLNCVNFNMNNKLHTKNLYRWVWWSLLKFPVNLRPNDIQSMFGLQQTELFSFISIQHGNIDPEFREKSKLFFY